MLFVLDRGILYGNNRRVCFGDATLAPGVYPLTVAYSHREGKNLPFVEPDIWFGSEIIVGDVKNRDVLLSSHTLDRIVTMITIAEECGAVCALEIEE